MKDNSLQSEVRFYLEITKTAIKGIDNIEYGVPAPEVPFVPTHLITVTKLPTGAKEVVVNTENIPEKIDYILENYDEAMKLKTNSEIELLNLMVI